MSDLTKKIMLVDESAFVFEPQSEKDKIQNAYLISFLDDARGAFDIHVVTEKSPEALTQKLAVLDLSEMLNDGHKRDQSFLQTSIRPWQEFEGTIAHVLMTTNDSQSSLLEEYEFELHPQSVGMPDYFGHFWDSYEDNLFMGPTGRFIGKMMASVQLDDIQRDRLLKECFANAGAVWNKIAIDPDVQALAGIFSQAEQRSWDKEHPQDKMLSKLKDYFKYAATDPLMKERSAKGNISSCRSHIKFELKMVFKEQYPDTDYSSAKRIEETKDVFLKAPLLPAHRRLLNRALLAIHSAIRSQSAPALS